MRAMPRVVVKQTSVVACKPHSTRRNSRLFLLALLIAGASPAAAQLFTVRNLVTDDQTVNAAQITDADLVNSWGISFSPTSPFWVANNGSGVATLYNVNPATNATTKNSLIVTIPGAGNPTGTVFANVSSSFNGDNFLFVSEDGTVSGWRSALGTHAETLVPASDNNVYKGATDATLNGTVYLYAADFRGGTIDVYSGNAAAPALPGTFTDPNIPAGYAPFNVENINDKLYVTYAQQDADKHDDVSGIGHGFVNVFDLQGNFLNRLASQGTLNSPWGMIIAPSTFGMFAGKLLVGNFGDGRINVFDPVTGAFLGQLRGSTGQPITIDGLWSLVTGNGGNAGNPLSVYFSAGPNDEMNGLFGVISAVPEPGSLVLLSLGLGMLAIARRHGVRVPDLAA